MFLPCDFSVFTFSLYFLNVCRAKYSLKRRLRIRTLQFETARIINDIYENVDPEVVLSILVHEVNLMT